MGGFKNIKRVALFGAAPDTPNMGVSALYMSIITGLSKYVDDLEFIVFDNNLGIREEIINIDTNKSIKIINFGARGGLRYYRPENLLTMLVMSKLGKLGAKLNAGIKLIDSCDAILDVSGGDSFSDIYGLSRFNNINRPKQIAINRNKPLVLLPQTYGPYKRFRVNKRAAKSVKGASIAWARDEDSFNILKRLLGDNFTKKKHHSGVDMAFGLVAVSAFDKLSHPLSDWILNRTSSDILVGINISGLIYNNPEKAKADFDFKADYQSIINDFISWILENTNANIVLISHVMSKPGHYESDLQACEKAASLVEIKYSERVTVSPLSLSECEVKWLISNFNWFCGTRMHSTIAGLSSYVPTAAISYSDKTIGVFNTCMQGKHVIDPRKTDTYESIEQLIASYRGMSKTKMSMPQHIKKVVSRVDDMMQEIASKI